MTTATDMAETETTGCLLCGADDARPLLRRRWPCHVVCRRCGLVYQNPRPTLAAIARHYQSSYWEQRGAITSDPQTERSWATLDRARAVVEWTRGRVGPGDLAVEIGCGHGEIISSIRDELGCRVIGVEPSAAQAEAAAKRYGLEMQVSDLESAALEPGSVKLLVLAHVVEHFHDPRAELAHCARLLVDDGLLFVEVPNMLAPSPEKRLSNWLSIEHMYYFSPASLERILRQVGFSIDEARHAGYVRFLARKQTAPQQVPGPRNEYWRVRRAVWWHEINYWPWYAARRLRQKIGL